MSAIDVRAVVHEVLGSHGDETILDYIVGETRQQVYLRWTTRVVWSRPPQPTYSLPQQAAIPHWCSSYQLPFSKNWGTGLLMALQLYVLHVITQGGQTFSQPPSYTRTPRSSIRCATHRCHVPLRCSRG